MGQRWFTTSTAFLAALRDAGVDYIFANLGSDHPGLVEAYARARQDGGTDHFPELIVCPHESVAFSAAHGYAQLTGRPQAVVVHVECGTQNIGGMLHNAARGRVPVLLYAGASPYTQHGELLGSRNEFIQWIQDVPDQRGIVRGYTKYDNEIRTGRNVMQLVHRAMQIARSSPPGPVYLMGPREVMEERLDPEGFGGRRDDPRYYAPIEPTSLDSGTVHLIADALTSARRPLVVTSYLGRDPGAVGALVGLCELLAIPVIESVPMYLNFPADHPLHWGYQWNGQEQNPLLADADTVLVLGSDVPWIPVVNRPADDARIFVVDMDPVKEQMPLWHVPAECFARADLALALRQLGQAVRERDITGSAEAIGARFDRARDEHDRQLAERTAREQPADGTITPEYLVACVREVIDDDAVVLTEAVSNFQVVNEHLRRNRPGSLIGSGGGSLGWHAGAAIGMKLADPKRTVVSLVGDGTFLFGVPSSAQWVARRYQAPSLTVIFDNQGWKAPKLSTLTVHPDGVAATNDDFPISFAPEADLPGVAAASGGAWARTVDDPKDVTGTLKEALDVVRGGRSAVISVRVAPV